MRSFTASEFGRSAQVHNRGYDENDWHCHHKTVMEDGRLYLSRPSCRGNERRRQRAEARRYIDSALYQESLISFS